MNPTDIVFIEDVVDAHFAFMRESDCTKSDALWNEYTALAEKYARQHEVPDYEVRDIVSDYTSRMLALESEMLKAYDRLVAKFAALNGGDERWPRPSS